MTDARFSFALDSMKKAAQHETRDNIFFSPHSIHQALSLAYFGARGTTEEALKRALRIPNELSKVDVQRYYAYERSLDEMRSQVSNSGAIVQLRDFTTRRRQRYVKANRGLLLHQRIWMLKVHTNVVSKTQMLGKF